MRLTDLEQPPYNTTLMAVVKGALDYYGISHSAARVYGGSGHAFLINIHEQLCPSGPYCWDYEPFYRLVHNLGLEMADLGFFHSGSSAEERTAIEATIKRYIDQRQVCSLLNMENQLVLGYDDARLHTAQPWPGCTDFPPAALTYGTWAEMGDEVHVSFFNFRPVAPADGATLVRDALAYAVAVFQQPRSSGGEPGQYAVGALAYDNWAKAVTAFGASHGNWWNATVWSECRAMASRFFGEMAEERGGPAGRSARELASMYEEIAAGMERASNKEMPAGEKAALILDLKSREAAAVEAIQAILPQLG